MNELKPGWRRVRFGEVVRLVSDRVDPSAAGIERYVGLEHIEPENLRIRSWGDVAEGTTFTSRFRPGDVLFGKRRAYQRKVALADFEGVCSGDIYVLESADPQQLLPELLPFICQTNPFFEHAVGTSAGSLSPRTNWGSMATYEFALPPLDEQQRIACVLNSSLRTEEALRGLAAAADALLRSALLSSFAEVQERRPLQDLCRLPITYGIVQAGPPLAIGVPYVRVSEMTGRDELDPGTMLRTSSDISSSYSRTVLEEGDVVIALRGVPGLCHQVRTGLAGANLSRGVARVAPATHVLAAYLLWALRSPQSQSAVRQYANGWKGEDLREITIAQLRSLPVPYLGAEKQEELAERLQQLEANRIASRGRLLGFKRISAMLRERVLEGTT